MKSSLKFCMNQAHRTIVRSAPVSCTACSESCASSSPRPLSSTCRRTPFSRASSAKARTFATEPGIAMSG